VLDINELTCRSLFVTHYKAIANQLRFCWHSFQPVKNKYINKAYTIYKERITFTELKSKRSSLCKLSTKKAKWSQLNDFHPESVIPMRFGQPTASLESTQLISDTFQLAEK